MQRKTQIAIAAGGLVLLAALVALLKPTRVPAAPLVRGTAVEAVYASGTVETIDRAEVRARTTGPLLELLVREGDAVHRGQLLARIDVPALRFDVVRGRADRDAARIRQEAAPQLKALQAQERGLLAQLAQARADLTRTEALVKKGVQPPQEEERARTGLDSAQAQLESNRAQQRDVRILLQADADRSEAGAASLMAKAADAEIRAPLDGVVLVRRVERGETVLSGQSLLRIGDLSRLHLEAQVDEADVGRLSVGVAAAVRLLAFDDRVVPGRVVRIAPEADRERKSFQVDIELSEAVEGLRPGMTAEINLLARRRDHVLLAPASALLSEPGR
ncbi:MAG: efflux RND transporter periplasmic adaptor subunit, partial [Deltaproteobacteria bacterium]|nr:efflux RND transporter periplasmic adaptor subunit [Deltaproteobacteria bacterium]